MNNWLLATLLIKHLQRAYTKWTTCDDLKSVSEQYGIRNDLDVLCKK